MNIRRATQADMPVLLMYAQQFIEFMDSRYVVYKEEHIRNILSLIIDKHVFAIAEKDGMIVGGIGAMYVPSIYDPTTILLTETFWWVGEEWRNTRAGWLLLDFLITFADVHTLPLVMSSLDKSGEGVDRLLQKRGFNLSEKSWVK